MGSAESKEELDPWTEALGSSFTQYNKKGSRNKNLISHLAVH